MSLTVLQYLQSRSNFWPELNNVTVSFDIDFVTGNVIDMNVNGIAIVSVPFVNDQTTTITNLINSVSNISSVRAELDSSDPANRTIIINGLSKTLVTVDTVIVTGGASQAVAEITLSRWYELLSDATDWVGSTFTACGQTNKAIAMLIMHWLTLEANGGGSGNAVTGSVKSKKEGDLSQTYAVGSSSNSNGPDGYYQQTVYGQEYLQIRYRCIMRPMNRMTQI
jgi:hypothetical protein